jgi:hypothetical protein
MFTKFLVVLIFLGVLASLGSGLFYLVRDKGQSDRVVKALSLRIGVSVALFALLFLLWATGFISPHGVRP